MDIASSTWYASRGGGNFLSIVQARKITLSRLNVGGEGRWPSRRAERVKSKGALAGRMDATDDEAAP